MYRQINESFFTFVLKKQSAIYKYHYYLNLNCFSARQNTYEQKIKIYFINIDANCLQRYSPNIMGSVTIASNL